MRTAIWTRRRQPPGPVTKAAPATSARAGRTLGRQREARPNPRPPERRPATTRDRQRGQGRREQEGRQRLGHHRTRLDHQDRVARHDRRRGQRPPPREPPPPRRPGRQRDRRPPSNRCKPATPRPRCSPGSEGQRGQDDRIERGPIRRRPAIDDEAPPLRQRPRQGQIVVGVLQAAERRHDHRPARHATPPRPTRARPRRNQEAESRATAISPGLRRSRTPGRGDGPSCPGRAEALSSSRPSTRSVRGGVSASAGRLRPGHLGRIPEFRQRTVEETRRNSAPRRRRSSPGPCHRARGPHRTGWSHHR